jgi:tol-pal system protein YbgF
MRLRTVLLLAPAVLSAGCATRADYEKVRRDQQEMRALLADTQVAVDKVNRRLDTMRSSLQEGTGSSAKGLQRRLDRLESRLALLEAGGIQAPAASNGGVVGGGPMPRTEAATIQLRREDVRVGNVDQRYRSALDLYRNGKTKDAVEQFRAFVRSSGSSDLADDAQYWIGESYYNLQDYNRAIIELNEVLLKYPKGDRVPTALLALATAFADSGDKIDARLILQKLVSDHPDSEEASVGRQQLQALAD